MTGGDSMDTIGLDEWEIVPGLGSSFFMGECTVVGGKDQDQLLFGSDLGVRIDMGYFTLDPASDPCAYDCILDEEEAMEPPVQAASPQQQHAVEFEDMGVVQAEPRRGELASEVAEVMVSGAEEEEEIVNGESPAAEMEACDEDEVMVEAAADHLGAEEEEEGVEGDREGMDCAGFSVGKLRVNGVGALCSFGVAAATFCILVLGGRPQHQQQQRKIMAQDHKSQFQAYADDERIHRAVEQASRLNQAVSSVMGGASTRATVSFGGYYNGF